MRRLFLTLLILVTATISYLFNSFKMEADLGKTQNSLDPPAELSAASIEGIKPYGYIKAWITRIVDGDTLVISYKGKQYKVRLLDVDTPETVKSGVSVQKYGKEATGFVQKKALNREARLIFEKDIYDPYGRLLSHIILKDGSYLNGLLVKNGYARVEIIKPNTLLSSYFLFLQEEAISQKTGFWALDRNKRPFIPDGHGGYTPAYLQ